MHPLAQLTTSPKTNQSTPYSLKSSPECGPVTHRSAHSPPPSSDQQRSALTATSAELGSDRNFVSQIPTNEGDRSDDGGGRFISVGGPRTRSLCSTAASSAAPLRTSTSSSSRVRLSPPPWVRSSSRFYYKHRVVDNDDDDGRDAQV